MYVLIVTLNLSVFNVSKIYAFFLSERGHGTMYYMLECRISKYSVNNFFARKKRPKAFSRKFFTTSLRIPPFTVYHTRTEPDTLAKSSPLSKDSFTIIPSKAKERGDFPKQEKKDVSKDDLLRRKLIAG